MKIVLFLSLLLTSFFLQAQNEDCITAQEILTKDSIVVELTNGVGDVADSYDNQCAFAGSNFESASKWYTFEISSSGNIYFRITPNFLVDDLDFFLFKSISGNCDNLESVRCNATSCRRVIGMSPDDSDIFEDSNCDDGENGFVKDLEVVEGEKYYLLINNFSATGNGYVFEFCGTALLSDIDYSCDDVYITKNNETKIEKFVLSPNPTSGMIKISNIEQLNTIEVYNIYGQNVQTISPKSEKVDIKAISGMYFLRFLLKNGDVVVKQLIIN